MNGSAKYTWTIPDESHRIPTDIPGEVQFGHVMQLLKVQKRTGWVNHGIALPESIADHMYRMGVLSLLLDEDENIDTKKCTQMALVHDMAESLVGDITPVDPNVTKEEKHYREITTMQHLTGSLLGSDSRSKKAGERILALFQEYEDGQTAEAKLVKDLDKIELAFQTVEYERSAKQDLSELIDSTDGKIRHPVLQGWLKAIHAERKTLWEQLRKEGVKGGPKEEAGSLTMTSNSTV